MNDPDAEAIEWETGECGPAGESTPYRRVTRAGEWYLLASMADWVAMHRRENARYATMPNQYPCAGYKALTADEETQYMYIYPDEVGKMYSFFVVCILPETANQKGNS